MTTLRFNISVDQSVGSEALSEAADHLKAKLSAEADLGDVVAQPMETGRGLAGAGAVIAIVAPLGEGGSEAVAAVVSALRCASSAGPAALSGATPESILVDVDGRPVPLAELTEQDLAILRDVEE